MTSSAPECDAEAANETPETGNESGCLLTRGVIYTLQQLSRPQKTAGVIAISTGNFASILCYYGWKFRIAVTVVILDSADDEVLELCEQYSNSVSSINVIKIKSDSLLEAHKFALAYAIKHGLVYLDSYNHPNMIIGQATVGLEILEQMCDSIDAVILPTTFNGCSLTEGMAVAIKRRAPEIQVIKVKPNAIDRNMEGVKQEALRNELNIPVRGRYFCYDNLEKSFIDKCITIDQAWIDIATEYLLDTESVCDLHASIALAPILSGQLDNLKGKSVIIPLFGRTDSMDFVKADRYAMLINAINRRYFTL
ncbi:uncharacterized protein LOC105428555 [Pogonomyrmex barbatus]|uniref:L-serine deaminase n=1 Tax=Pogonomyrmex barbatus TaxID=144034 RepID=A0A6I9WB15_9HYME|nr:uncharacterized protein LOC105428555 [Pogonomyrmex barbatus]